MTISIFRPGLQYYVDLINGGHRFSFTRYGNGEWDLVLGRGVRTGSGSQKFTPDLREAMRETLLDHHGGTNFPAMQSTKFLKRLSLLPKIDQWLREKDIVLIWHCGEVFHRNSRRGSLLPLVDALRNQYVVVVGPSWLQKLPFADRFIEVRKKDCWSDVDDIYSELVDVEDALVCFSAGPTAKVLVHRLYPVIGEHSWLIDTGSLWDVYCGKKSRQYHKKITTDVIRSNLGGGA